MGEDSCERVCLSANHGCLRVFLSITNPRLSASVPVYQRHRAFYERVCLSAIHLSLSDSWLSMSVCLSATYGCLRACLSITNRRHSTSVSVYQRPRAVCGRAGVEAAGGLRDRPDHPAVTTIREPLQARGRLALSLTTPGLRETRLRRDPPLALRSARRRGGRGEGGGRI